MATSKTDPTAGELRDPGTATVTSSPIVTASTAAPAEVAPGPDLGTATLQDRPPMKDIDGVRYTGTSDVRIVSATDFARAGVEGVENDLVFNRENGFTVEKKGLSAAAVDLLFSLPDFDIV